MNVIATAAANGDKLYEQVSRHISRLIEQGTLRPGERVPSVRRLSQQQQVSIATVMQAYRLLESQGFIEARPQSGYFVRLRHWRPPAEPAISKPKPVPATIKTGALMMRVMEAIRDPSLVRFGAALPSPELLPTEKLNRTMAAAARRHPELSNSFDVPPGNTALRNQIARRAIDTGCELSPDDIITTFGGQEALHLCLRAVAKPGDTIAIESPTYFGILQVIESLGMKALEIPTHPREGVSLEALAYALEQQPVQACLFVLNYNNPLGSCMPDEHKRRLVEMLAAKDIPLIEDDIYGDLSHAQERPRTAKSYDQKGLVLLCDSFSKTLAPGYRVGWTSPGRFKEQVSYYKLVSTVATASLPQMAIADFLANGGYGHHLRKVRREYAHKVQLFTEAICKYFPEETKVTRPTGGHVLWLELPAQVKAVELFELALGEKISIAPGPVFSARQRFDNFIRLNCANPWTPALENALLRLGRLVGRLQETGVK
jgi:DNA-binding transcriptional MocR family regulator